jgi:hypothetical protein
MTLHIPLSPSKGVRWRELGQPVYVSTPGLDLDDPANDIAGHQIFFGIGDRFYPSLGLAINDQR